MPLCLLIIGAFFAGSASGERVLMVGKSRQVLAVSVLAGVPWKRGDEACVQPRYSGKACGEIISAHPTVAYLKVDRKDHTVLEGDKVKPTGRSRRLANEPVSPPSSPTIPDSSTPYEGIGLNFSFAIHFGTNFFFTGLHGQALVGERFAFGLEPVYSSANFSALTASAVGMFATANYYAKGNYQGIWAQIGLGFLKISATDGAISEQATAPAALCTAGYRYKVLPQLNLGGGLGLQWTGSTSISLVEVHFRSLRPVVILDVGYLF